MTNWQTVEIQVMLEQEELASWLMLQGGANGCRVNQNNNELTTVQATFKTKYLTDQQLNILKSSFQTYGLEGCLTTLSVKNIPDADWLSEWKKGFEPFVVGERLLVCPSWLKDQLPEDSNHKVIVIEPGMAFGTDLHATTQYCLQQITQLSSVKDILDIGTGSGILAIASALCLPQAHITAMDIDPASIDNAHHNLALNKVENQVDLRLGTTSILSNLSFDCILSNLTCEDIVSLLQEYLRLLHPGGTVICAGILKEKLPLLEQAIATYPLSITQQEVAGEWVGVRMSRIPALF